MHCTTDKLIPVLTKPSSDNKTLVQKKNSVVEDGSNINVYEMSSQTYGEVDSVVYHNSNLKANNQDWEKPLKVVDTSHSDKSFVEESDSISNAYNSFLQPKPYSIIERTTVVINTVDEITPSSTADVKIDSQTALPFVSREYTQAENVMDNQNKLKVIKEKNNINKEIFAGEILKTEGVKSSVKNEKPNENIHMFSTKMVGNDHYHYNNDNKVDENIQNYNDNKVNNSNNNDVTKGDNYYSESGGDENHENANDHDGGWNDKGVDIGSDPGKNMLIKKLEQQQQQQQNIMGSSTILPNNFLKGSETVEKVSLLHATTSTNSYSIISGSELLSEQEVGENHIRDSIIINSVDKQVELINEVTTNKKTNDKNLENAILQGDDMPSLPLIPNSLKSTGVHEIQNNFDEKEFVHGTLNELNSVMSNIDFSASVAPQTEQTISEETISNQIESNAQNSYGDFQVTPAFNHKANYIKSVMEIPGDNLHEVIKSDVEVIAETFNELPLQHSRSIPDGNESLKPTADVVEQSSNLVEEVKSTLRNNVTPSFVDVSESESTAESFGFFSQVTDTLTIKTGSKKDETNYEEKNEIADARSSNPDVAKVEDDLISNESGKPIEFSLYFVLLVRDEICACK